LTVPTPTAPRIDPSYGVVPDASGAEVLPWSWAAEQLAGSRNYWVSTTRPDGRPHSTPVWGVWLDGAVWFCVGRTSVKARNVAGNPAVAIHLESGDQVVILEGRVAERHDGLEPFLDAYEAKYELRPDLAALDAVVYVLLPDTALTWDERDYPKSAVRWVFSRT
jgi:hypothetical protein